MLVDFSTVKDASQLLMTVFYVRVCAQLLQSCLFVTDPMDYSPPGSSTHGIFQAGILKWVAILFSRGVYQIQGLNPQVLHYRWVVYQLSHKKKTILCTVCTLCTMNLVLKAFFFSPCVRSENTSGGIF